LLAAGVDAIEGGRAAVIDLAGVTASDSSGLALLIEWLSVAKGASRTLRFENIPSQLQQLARLSEVEELLVPDSRAMDTASVATVTRAVAAGAKEP
jgi:ABC-type transporter Mla MlaB component